MDKVTKTGTATYPASAVTLAPEPATARLRLYVARSTPNSVRAEHNLAAVLRRIPTDRSPPTMEIIDVFAEPKRAATEGIFVTPTLMGVNAGRRILLMGDLADQAQLQRILEDWIEDGAGA